MQSTQQASALRLEYFQCTVESLVCNSSINLNAKDQRIDCRQSVVVWPLTIQLGIVVASHKPFEMAWAAQPNSQPPASMHSGSMLETKEGTRRLTDC